VEVAGSNPAAPTIESITYGIAVQKHLWHFPLSFTPEALCALKRTATLPHRLAGAPFRERSEPSAKQLLKSFPRFGDELEEMEYPGCRPEATLHSPIIDAKRKRELSIMFCLEIRPFLVAAILCVLSPLFCVAQEPAVSSEVSYVSFEIPGALGTYPMSINNSMAVAGYYYASFTVTRGFLRDPDGAITTFDVPGGFWTEPESINAAGEITGFYEVVSGIPQGFVRYPNGHMVTFDPPGFRLNPPQAQPVSVNDFGVIAGNYPFPLVATDGFTRSAAGEFTSFGFGDGADYATTVTGLNASGTTVGFFVQNFPGFVSFLQHPDGFSTQFFVPVNGGGDGHEATIAESINADGVIAGWYTACADPCATITTGGFVRSPQGVFTLFTPPGSIVTSPRTGYASETGSPAPESESLSAPHRLSINFAGTISGSYKDIEGAQHGFVRNPYGTITSFDPPRGGQTTATSINDSGVIAGSYFYDWNTQIAQGFLRLPKP
jgi:hypothetical protein